MKKMGQSRRKKDFKVQKSKGAGSLKGRPRQIFGKLTPKGGGREKGRKLGGW